MQDLKLFMDNQVRYAAQRGHACSDNAEHGDRPGRISTQQAICFVCPIH